MQKQNKIMVAVHGDDDTRREIMKSIIQRCKLASTPGDAGKLIQNTVDNINLETAYIVIADNFNFSKAGNITLQKLTELAARGIAVILGVRRLPQQYEFLCEAYY